MFETSVLLCAFYKIITFSLTSHSDVIFVFPVFIGQGSIKDPGFYIIVELYIHDGDDFFCNIVIEYQEKGFPL
jgi:hypothetical protein